MKQIIIASTSPRRHGLLQQIGLDFKVVPSEYEEDMTMNLSPAKLVKLLAEGKAQDVAKKYKGEDCVVIGVDTFLVFGNKKLGKPHDAKTAFKMLKLLSGKTVKVYSGLAMIDTKTGKKVVDHEVTGIKMKQLTANEIRSYIDTKEPLDKAGAIAIQGLGAIFVRSVSGCYANVIGLPLHLLYKNLSKFGVDIFKHEKWKNYVE